MNFTITKENRLSIFHLSEPRLDSINAPEVKAELLIVCQEDIDVLIIDLTDVTFCDTNGLSALLLAQRQMRERGGGTLIVDKHGKIKTLVDIAKLGDILFVFPTVEEARMATEE